MNRLTKAWKALRGTLEPEVRVETKVEERETLVYGEAVKVALFRAEDPRYERCGRAVSFGINPSYGPAEWHGTHYATCAQAFAECPGANVVEVEVWRIGFDYYKSPTLFRLKVQPKPKRPKGKASA